MHGHSFYFPAETHVHTPVDTPIRTSACSLQLFLKTPSLAQSQFHWHNYNFNIFYQEALPLHLSGFHQFQAKAYSSSALHPQLLLFSVKQWHAGCCSVGQ